MLADVMRCSKVRIHIASLGENKTFVLRCGDRVVHEVLVGKCCGHRLDHVIACGDWLSSASQRELVADQDLGEVRDNPKLEADPTP